jgi:hypothetical protein
MPLASQVFGQINVPGAKAVDSTVAEADLDLT